MPRPGDDETSLWVTVRNVRSNRLLAGALALATLLLAIVGETLVLTHRAGAAGLILLAFGAGAGVAAWAALGTPRTRADRTL